MARITNFIYGLILVGVISVAFSLFFVGLADGYNLEYDNASLEAYNNLEAINSQTAAVKTGVDGIAEKPGIFDIVGGYMSSAWNALKITKGSFDTFDAMSNEAIENANLGVFGDTLKVAIGAMVIVFIFIGVMLGAILKWLL